MLCLPEMEGDCGMESPRRSPGGGGGGGGGGGTGTSAILKYRSELKSCDH